jgi:hypothetical protein
MQNLILVLLLCGFISINAQTSKTKEKLKNLKGEVTKITIETNDGEVEIIGEDAAVLLKKMKAKKNFTIKKMNHCDFDDHDQIFIEKRKHHLEKEIEVEVEISESDGEKVVVVKKNIGGKEIVEVLKGEKAEEYLKSHSSKDHDMKFITEDGDVNIVVDVDSDDLHWISEDCDKELTKKIIVEDEDGVKKVTVTTIEDGEKKIEIFVGDEAKEYIEKMEHGKKIKINFSDDGKKKVKKIIIREEDDDHDED